MKFGFITSVLKSIGGAVLPVAEQVGVAAANTAVPGLGGFLANIAINGINNAIAKHGTAPSITPSPSDPTMTVGQAKKFDVLQLFESQAPDILNLILAGQNKKVIDRQGFVDGTDALVEAFLKIMKSIGAVPSSTPMADPVVITPAVVTQTQEAPAPAPTAVPQAMGTVLNLNPQPIDPQMLAQLVAAVRASLGK